jgi:hypothetical protein
MVQLLRQLYRSQQHHLLLEIGPPNTQSHQNKEEEESVGIVRENVCLDQDQRCAQKKWKKEHQDKHVNLGDFISEASHFRS